MSRGPATRRWSNVIEEKMLPSNPASLIQPWKAVAQPSTDRRSPDVIAIASPSASWDAGGFEPSRHTLGELSEVRIDLLTTGRPSSSYARAWS